jgi:predicted RNA binding protein YcfA (HicA-like mRNA interferase family)
MNFTAKHLKKVALKLGYLVREGKRHTLVYHPDGRLVTTMPRGKIKTGSLAAILKQLDITAEQLKRLL